MTTMTDAQTSTYNRDLILNDLTTITDVLSTMTKADVLAIGTKLNEVIKVARECYRNAQEPCRCGNWVEHCTCKRERLERVRCQCPQCQRTWVGNDLAAAGTVESKVCGICKAGKTEQPKAVAPVVTEVSEPISGTIPDGTYTVEFAGGDYRTIRIKTQAPDANWMPGKRVASYLNGPDNWSNYQGFAFVNDDNTFSVWHKHQSAGTIISALAVICSGKEAMVNGLKAYGHRASKCGLCGRKLTTPESIKMGIGPICLEKAGL